MFESIHDLLRFLVQNVRGQAAETDVKNALDFIDAHEEGTDGSLRARPVPDLTAAEKEQLAALQAKQDAKAADNAQRAEGGTLLTADSDQVPAGGGTPAAVAPGSDG